MKTRDITILILLVGGFFFLKNKNILKKKKKYKPIIEPGKLQNITESEYYGTKSEFKAGIAQNYMNAGDALSNGISAGIINVNELSKQLPIASEIKSALNCENC